MSDLTLSSPRAEPPAVRGRADVVARLRPAIAGAIGALAGIGLSELVAGFLGAPSLLAAVGTFVIDHQPAGAKDVVVSLFGTNDKLALETLIVVLAAVIGAGLGIIAVRRSATLATLGFGAFALAGFLATLQSPDATPTTAMVVALVAALVGAQVMTLLLRAGGAGTTALGTPLAIAAPDWSRRSFLVQAGAVAIASSAAGLVGRRLLEGGATQAGAPPLPGAAVTATIPGGAELAVDGLTSLVVPNDRFYRIDTALITPTVDASTWHLRVHGMVDREVVLSYAELGQLPMFEQYVTIACVSNEVGGNLVGNAKWTGVRLRDVLGMAGVQAGATQLVGRAVDGWTAGMPTAWVMDSAREPMIALKMNDTPLPKNHGFPARLIVPGLYGYVSATKWLAELELTTLEAFDGYWVPLGWSKEGPILTQSRIDVPGNGQRVAAGRVPIAGVAWAPDRGVTRVEVAIDGQWRDAQLSTPISKATWVQWLYAWDAAAAGPGDHVVEVRATDGSGQVQTADRTPPAPDGARGHETIRVTVG
ncbi:MAG TPA: molybdopterin-dependent oxidoreductase [Candidatus Limnocylindrales bacterium]|jgi:DMSO/TMAO reductase YedYZ molybdopterin-dependent catalytic subunit|nr:molybdopterin-dependent oxidoreductase [Candidatus Limnocylindrales bacterium]